MLRRTGPLAILTLLTAAATVGLAVEPSQIPGRSSNPRATIGRGGAPGLRQLDANHDGQVSKPEFDNAARKLSRRSPSQSGASKTGARVFNRLDTDNNGALSHTELEKLRQLRARKKGGR